MTPTDPPARRLLTLPLGADSTTVPAARHRLAAVLREHPVPDELADAILLVASELVTNAVEHGGGAERLELEREPDAVVLRVSDRGPGLPEQRPRPLDSVRGRGLALVEALTSGWGYQQEDGGKSVWSRFELPQQN